VSTNHHTTLSCTSSRWRRLVTLAGILLIALFVCAPSAWAYDGRLATLNKIDFAAPSTEAVDYHYDASNELVLEERLTPGAALEQIYHFKGHRETVGAQPEVVQQVLPMVRLKNGVAKWVFTDIDQHALHVWSASGVEESFELTGVYGGRFDTPAYPQYYQGASWELDGLHGDEVDHARGLVHRGQRHAFLDDGRWLQPEPLLGVGPGSLSLERPGEFLGVYAGANPLAKEDTSGDHPILIAVWAAAEVAATVADVTAVAYSGYTAYNEPSLGNYLSLGADAGLAAAGMVSVGGGAAAVRHGPKIAKAAKAGGGMAKKAAGKLVAKGKKFLGGGKAAKASKGVPTPKVRGNPNTAPARGTTFVDPKGNAITTPPGGKITGSPDGKFIQARDAGGNPTGVRIDGGHKPAGHPDPRAQGPHGHVPDVTNPDGTPWLPIKE